ncbi:CDP-diacylglycerol--glycerol-3-phosphate 3-phosphatidyltransferase [Rarobacter faecitabidus]
MTAIRVVLAPVLAVVLAMGGTEPAWRWIAAALFLATALTDRLDGHLARSRNTVTDLGKLLDPIADKLLIGVALVALSALGELWWWVTILILARELGITFLRLLLVRIAIIPASQGGKIKTALQVAGITLALLPLWTLPSAVRWSAHLLLAVAVVVTVATGVQYVVDALRLAAANRREGGE